MGGAHKNVTIQPKGKVIMALPEMIPSSELRRVTVEGSGGHTLYDLAEDVRAGRVRLAVAGTAAARTGTLTPEVEVDGRTVHVTVTVE